VNWLVQGLSSSVGKKFVMGVTGLLLCGFLAMHLAGNLLLYVGEETYNAYAHALHSQEWLIKIAEVVLLVLFVGHIALALVLTQENQAARPIDYATRQSKKDTPVLIITPDNWMFVSGVIVLLFLLLHLSEFAWNIWLTEAVKGKEPFEKARIILTDPLSTFVYIVGPAVLGFHLWHGFASAFQSLGLNHEKYTPLITWLGIIFAVLVAVGFASFPIWAWATMETL